MQMEEKHDEIPRDAGATILPPQAPSDVSATVKEIAPTVVFPFPEELKPFIIEHLKDADAIRKHIFHELGTMPTPHEIGLAIRSVSEENRSIQTAHSVLSVQEASEGTLATAYRAAERAIQKYEETGDLDHFKAWKEASEIVVKLQQKSPGVTVNTQVNNQEVSPMMQKILDGSILEDD